MITNEVLWEGERKSRAATLDNGDAGNRRYGSRRISTSLCYPRVEAVARAFEILRIVNLLGVATVGELHTATRQNKSTIVRMLQTLIDQGYLTADELCGGYRVTGRVETLSHAYMTTSRIIETVRDRAIAFTEKFKWPLSLAMGSGPSLTVLFDTSSLSPWVSDARLLRTSPNLLRSAIGRAYCTFSNPQDLDAILAHLRSDRETPLSWAEEQMFLRTLTVFSQKGYSDSHPSETPPRVNMVAMPVRTGSQVRAVIGCSFYRSVVPQSQVTDKIVRPLSDLIAEIERDVSTEVDAANRPPPVQEAMS